MPRTLLTGRPPSRRAATRFIARAGEAYASLAGLLCVTERSPSSESIYLHVRRGETWRGVRVSCHPPAHVCCFDYEQWLCPERPTEAAVRRLAVGVRGLVERGGRVVADPAVVEAAIDRLANAVHDGRRYRDRDGRVWSWDADGQAWRPTAQFNPTAQLNGATPPTHRPGRWLSARVRCEVRHAQNVAAVWAYEETRGCVLL